MPNSAEAMIQDKLKCASWGLTSVGPSASASLPVSLLLQDDLDHNVDLTSYTAEAWIRYEEDDPLGLLACQVGNVLFIGLLDPFDRAVHTTLGGDHFPTRLEIVFGRGERSVRAPLGGCVLPTEEDIFRKRTCRKRSNWLARAAEYAQSFASSWHCAAGQPAIEEVLVREITAGADGRPLLRTLEMAGCPAT